MPTKIVLLRCKVRQSHGSRVEPVQIVTTVCVDRHVATDLQNPVQVDFRHANSRLVEAIGQNCTPGIDNLKLEVVINILGTALYRSTNQARLPNRSIDQTKEREMKRNRNFF